MNTCDKPALLPELLEQCKSIFLDELGRVSSHHVLLRVRPGAVPIFSKPHPIPFAIRDTIGTELDRLEKEGILEKVSHTNEQPQ